MSKPKLAVIVGGNLAAAGSGDKDNIDGLGTAATRDVGTDSGDLMPVGAFGVGVNAHTSYSDFLLIPKLTGVYQTAHSPANAPENTGTAWTVFVSSISSGRAFMIAMGAGDGNSNSTRNNRIYYKWMNNGAWDSPWIEFLHTGNIQSTTGQSASYPMSQKAVTDALTNTGSLAPSSATYEYDELGQVNKIITPDGDTLIAYNPDGTVESIIYPTGRIETYTYDASGNVISMTATGG